jgi:fructokinase
LTDKLWGAVEAGGTKFICLAGRGPHDIVAERHIATTSPEQTLRQVVDFFKGLNRHNQLQTIGIGSFGPLDLDANSPSYGYITATPKEDWSNVDIRGVISRALNVPVTIDTDVNAAALAEGRWGIAAGCDNFVYITIGTGIGGGAVIDGKVRHGLNHLEMGHMLIKHDLKLDPFKGCCRFHTDCLEGLASGAAINLRYGRPAESLYAKTEVWELEADYIAQGIVNIIYLLSPQKIILGGGVMKFPALLKMVQNQVLRLINGYLAGNLVDNIAENITAAGLGEKSGVLGALLLAKDSYTKIAIK